MDIRYEKIIDEVEKQGQQARQHQEPPSAAAASAPPSASSSPSHEFSFSTISVHPSAETAIDDKTKSPPSSSSAVDLSPADEIFFHGHLLPLHLLSHLPVLSSPRSSTNSLDSFTLPLKDYTEERIFHQNHIISNNFNGQNETHHNHNVYYQTNDHETKPRTKSKSFSFFGLQKWRKGCEVKAEKEEHERQQKRKLGFDISHVLKRYIRMVRPLLSFGSRRSKNMHFQKQPYSFSGNTSFRDKEIRGRRRIQYSAPASMRTSPNNSGPLLIANGTIPKTTSDSTMEELQAAIQAAITHCKNSIAMEDKKQSHD